MRLAGFAWGVPPASEPHPDKASALVPLRVVDHFNARALARRLAMERDDGFDADNPYHSVALIYAGFLCDVCGAYCSGMPDGTLDTLHVPYRVMAETVARNGWRVEDRDKARYDYCILCPDCSR